jgi:hypothetical protein
MVIELLASLFSQFRNQNKGFFEFGDPLPNTHVTRYCFRLQKMAVIYFFCFTLCFLLC